MIHRNKNPLKAMAVVSGGLDSTVSLYMAAKRYKVPYGIFFNYDQKALPMEMAACRKLARRLNIKLFIVDLPWLSRLSSSSLVSSRKTIPHLKIKELGNKDLLRKTADSVMVQNRNMIFLSCAAGIALEKGCSILIAGFNAEEAETFPDNSIKFVRSINKTFSISASPRKIRVISPVLSMTKKDIVHYAKTREISLDTVYSCYFSGTQMCGRCESCIRLKNALIANDYLEKSGIIFKYEQ